MQISNKQINFTLIAKALQLNALIPTATPNGYFNLTKFQQISNKQSIEKQRSSESAKLQVV